MRRLAAGRSPPPRLPLACRRRSSSLVAAADRLTVLPFGQWQGACGADDDNRPRYERGATALRRSMRVLLPRATHLQQVMIEEDDDPSAREDSTRSSSAGIAAVGSNRWGPILRQQQQALALLKEPDGPATAQEGGAVITLGGDCGIEPVPIGFANNLHEGHMAVLWLDSHGDLNSIAESPSKNFHGMALRALLDPACCGYSEDEAAEIIPLPLYPWQIVMAGVRSLDVHTPGQYAYVIQTFNLPLFWGLSMYDFCIARSR